MNYILTTLLIAELLFNCVKVSAQTYRAFASNLEPHPWACDLFIEDDSCGLPSYVLMVKPSISLRIATELNEIKTQKFHLISANLELVVDSDSIARLVLKGVEAYGNDTLNLQQRIECISDIISAEIEKARVNTIYGCFNNTEPLIILFYYDPYAKRDIPCNMGRLFVKQEERERRRTLLNNYINKYKIVGVK